jgi:L-lactate utilization protein LutB
MFDEILKAHEELEELNNQIIREKDNYIKKLENYILELKTIIETNILRKHEKINK